MPAKEEPIPAELVVIGAGAIGSGLLAMVPSLNVSKLTIVDGDTVEEANLLRQPLYGPTDIGRYKVEAAKDRISHALAKVPIISVTEFVGPSNIERLLIRATIVADCTDDLHVTKLIDEWCAANGTCLVTGAVHGSQCQVTSQYGPGSLDHGPFFKGRIGPGQDGCDMRSVPAAVTQMAAVQMAWRIGEFLSGRRFQSSMDLLDITTGSWMRILPPMRNDAVHKEARSA